jgi:hypothetical protein
MKRAKLPQYRALPQKPDEPADPNALEKNRKIKKTRQYHPFRNIKSSDL